MRILFVALLGLSLLSCGSKPEPTQSPEPAVTRTASADGAEVFFISPANGATTSTEFTVAFGLRGMDIATAGTEMANTGHHHLLIDGDSLPPLDAPMTDNVMHFGGGQTEVALTLEPGNHTLQLILGDHFHVPHDPPIVSEKIAIVVE